MPFNINALEEEGRNKIYSTIFKIRYTKKLCAFIVAFYCEGKFKTIVSNNSIEEDVISSAGHCIYNLCNVNSLIDWARLLLQENLFCADARIIGLTSEGAHKYWESYAAVSMAKSSLESIATYMAVEFGKHGIKTNLIQAGITETPSLKKIPGSDKLIGFANAINPLGRITMPVDVANVIYLLCTGEAAWINGSVIHVDGGEHCR